MVAIRDTTPARMKASQAKAQGRPRAAPWDIAAPCVVKVTGSASKRVWPTALICIKPWQRGQLLCRVHQGRLRRKDQRKGFTEAEYPGC